MMHELEFRGWHKDKKRMFPILSFDVYEVIEASVEHDPNEKPSRMGEYEREEIEIIQYTGLKDKNGRKIYGSDILRYEDKRTAIVTDDYPVEVVWNEKEAAWFGGRWRLGPLVNYTSTCEVIGNTFENPELLKESVEGLSGG